MRRVCEIIVSCTSPHPGSPFKKLFPNTEYIKTCSDIVYCDNPAVEVVIVNKDTEVAMCAEHFDEHAKHERKWLRLK